ncbi:MAG: hypothetical protein HY459_02795 [Parcubacteria group bacterium]|nr:hypothetical protein [Parcubacteria group bacterium]
MKSRFTIQLVVIVGLIFLGFVSFQVLSDTSKATHQPLEVKWIRVVKGSKPHTVDVVARIVNPNQDVGSPRFEYTIILRGQRSVISDQSSERLALSPELLATRGGTGYILPDEEKYLIELSIPVPSTETLPEASLTFGNTSFRVLPEPQELHFSFSNDKLISDVEKGTTEISGTIKNDLSEPLKNIELQIVVYPFSLKPNPADATSAGRALLDLEGGEERSFTFLWPWSMDSLSLYDLAFEVDPY